MADYRLTALGDVIVRNTDGAFVPVDPANFDYVAFLAWEALGNTPDAARIPPRLAATASTAAISPAARFQAASCRPRDRLRQSPGPGDSASCSTADASPRRAASS